MGDLLCYVLDYAEEPHAITIAMVIKFPTRTHMANFPIWSDDPSFEFKALAVLNCFLEILGNYVAILRMICVDRRL